MKVTFQLSVFAGVFAAGVYFYFSSQRFSVRHPQWFAGFDAIVWALIVLAALSIWWVIYFILTKDFRQLWMPLLLVIPFALQIANSQILKISEQRRHSEWFQRATNKVYRSEKLGVVFSYVSEDEWLGVVSVTENENEISVSAGPTKEILKVYSKDETTDLLGYLKDQYAETFPSCLFYQSETSPFPKPFNVVAFSETNGGACPILGPNSNSAGRDYFFETKEHSTKFFFLSLAPTSTLSARPTVEAAQPVKWFESLQVVRNSDRHQVQ